MGVIYLIYQVALKEHPLDQQLLLASVAWACCRGSSWRRVNYLFLAKRQKIRRLSAELDEARANGRQLEKQIREAGRV
jgi:hypothetical protein